MCLRSFILACVAITTLTNFSLLNAATIKISDGSVIIGEIENRSSETYTIRMKNGARVNIRSCDIIEVLEQGIAVAIEEPETISTLRFSGSNTIGEKLVPAISEAYLHSMDAHDAHWISEKENERTLEITDAKRCMPKKIVIKAHGSATAFRDLASAEADVGMSSRRVKPQELSALASLGDLTEPDAEHILVLDGLAIIIHPDNPIAALTIDEIARIFTGKAKDWSDVGGEPAPINVYARDEKSGTYDTFNSLVLKRQGRILTSSAQRFESSTKLSDSVARDPNSIGFIGLAYIRDAKPLAINECELHYYPTSFNIKTEEYPLTRRLYLYVPTRSPSTLARDFLQFSLEQEGQQVVQKIGFIGLDIENHNESGQDQVLLSRMKTSLEIVQNVRVLKQYLDTVEGATRLSTTFRFRDGSSRLDNRALRDIKRLADYIKNGEYTDKQILLLGFTDTRGEYKNNLALSLARARSVADQLTWNGVRNVSIEGFGEEVPAACNSSIEGFKKNRRVESWIR